MFESYSVGVTLRLHNFVTPSLLQIGQEFKLVQGYSDALRVSLKATELEAKGLAAALRSINAGTPGRRSAAARAADETTESFKKATEAAQKYKTTMQGASMAAPHAGAIHPTSPLFAHAVAAQQSAIASTLGSSLATQMAIAQRMSSTAMTHHLPSMLAQQAAMAASYGPQMAMPHLAGPAGMPYTPFRMRTPGGGGAGAGGPGGVPPGGGGGGGGAHPGAAGGGRGGFHGGNVHVGPGGIGIGAIGFSAGGAAVPLIGAAASVYAGKALYESARDYETAMTRYKTLNLGDKANKEADLFARRTQVQGVSSTQLIETLRESVGIFGSIGDAMKVSPMVAQLNMANSNLFGGKIGKIDEGAARAIFRFNDIRGLTNSPEDFAKGLDVAQRLVTGSSGAIQFKDLEQFAKRGGVAFRSLSDEGMLMYATVLQEKGGNAAGTGMMSMYQNLVAGRITKKAMAALETSGLATLGTVDTGTVGGKKSKSTVIKSIVDEEMLRTNQGGWIIKNGIPAAMRLGDRTDAQIAARINSWLSNRTGADNAVSFGVQHLQALRDRNMTANAAGYAQTIALQQQTLGGKQGEFMAAWSNFKTEFGLGALPAFSKMLTGGSSLLREINITLESSGAKALISMYEKGFKFQSDGLESLVRTYRDGFSKQGDLLGKAGNFLFGEKQTTGVPVAGKETDGGAFTGYRSPIRTGSAGGGRGFINNVIVMPDGRELARVVTREQGKELQRPPTGPRTADGRQSIRAFDTATGG